jgi:hypothetical protein
MQTFSPPSTKTTIGQRLSAMNLKGRVVLVALVAGTLLSSCYPAKPYQNPLSPDQVRTLLIRNVRFLSPASADATAVEINMYRRFALRSAACRLGKHFNKRGSATLTFWLREFEVGHEAGNTSVASALSAKVEGPGLKGEYSIGLATDARTNVPNPPSPADEGATQAAIIVEQLLWIQADHDAGSPAAFATGKGEPCLAELERDIRLAR